MIFLYLQPLVLPGQKKLRQPAAIGGATVAISVEHCSGLIVINLPRFVSKSICGFRGGELLETSPTSASLQYRLLTDAACTVYRGMLRVVGVWQT